MEYQKKKANLLDNNLSNKPPKFRTKNQVEINDDSANSDIRLKTTMLRFNLCDYADACILVKGTITITGGPNNATDADERTDERDKSVIFENCAPFTKCISRINGIDRY